MAYASLLRTLCLIASMLTTVQLAAGNSSMLGY